MQRTKLFNEFKTILSEHVPGEDSFAMQNINEHTNLVDDLGIESLDVVNIVIDMEDHFKIEIDNDSIKKMSTVGNCLDLIQEKLCAICN
jgi:acyl carrier protein